MCNMAYDPHCDFSLVSCKFNFIALDMMTF